jgi:hypothetical protein
MQTAVKICAFFLFLQTSFAQAAPNFSFYTGVGLSSFSVTQTTNVEEKFSGLPIQLGIFLVEKGTDRFKVFATGFYEMANYKSSTSTQMKSSAFGLGGGLQFGHIRASVGGYIGSNNLSNSTQATLSYKNTGAIIGLSYNLPLSHVFDVAAEVDHLFSSTTGTGGGLYPNTLNGELTRAFIRIEAKFGQQ